MTIHNSESLPGVDSYRTAINRLHFSDEDKARMAARLAEAAAKEQPMTICATPNRKRHLSLAAAAAGIAVALGLGGIAYAAGGLIDVPQFARHLFGAGDAKVEVINKVGRLADASQSVNGVTVSADAIIGDKSNVAVIFSLSKDDGTPFEGIKDVEALDNGALPLGFSEDITVDLPPTSTGWSTSGTSYLYDANPNDNSIQLVETRSYKGMWGEDVNIAGSMMTAHLCDLTLYGDGEPTVVAPGTWTLSFPLSYEDASVELPHGQTFELGTFHEDDEAGIKGQVDTIQATVDELSVSPIALHLRYSVDQKADWTLQKSGQDPEHDRQPSDMLLGVDVTVTLRDGSNFDLTSYGEGAISSDSDVTHCECGILFDRIIDVDEIASITIGGTTIELG